MVYRLKNWMFCRDLMCSHPRLTADMISKILKSDMEFMEIDNNDIVRMVNSSSCVMSQNGLEASLTIWRQTLSINLTGEKFEEFLEKFDELLEEAEIRIGMEHHY